LPSHVPSRPQVVGSLFGQPDGTRGAAPAARDRHFPSADCVPQDLQVSVQAVSQHRPSTQNPLLHSPAQPQVAPFGFVPPPSGPQGVVMVPASGWLAGLPCVWHPAQANRPANSAKATSGLVSTDATT
jgi:hypothetical protein